MDKNSIFRVQKSEKGRIMEFGEGLQTIGVNIWGPKMLSSIFWVQKSEKGRIMEFGEGLQTIGVNIWGPKMLSSIFGVSKEIVAWTPY